MAPPVCSRCGSTALAFLSDELVWNWRDEKGVKWDYKDGLGYMVVSNLPQIGAGHPASNLLG